MQNCLTLPVWKSILERCFQQIDFPNAYWEGYDQIQSQYYFKQSPHIGSG